MLGLAGIQMNNLNQGQGQQLALPAPVAPAPVAPPPPAQHVPLPIIVHHAGGNQYKPAIMSPEFVDKMEQYRTDAWYPELHEWTYYAIL